MEQFKVLKIKAHFEECLSLSHIKFHAFVYIYTKFKNKLRYLLHLDDKYPI